MQGFCASLLQKKLTVWDLVDPWRAEDVKRLEVENPAGV